MCHPSAACKTASRRLRAQRRGFLETRRLTVALFRLVWKSSSSLRGSQFPTELWRVFIVLPFAWRRSPRLTRQCSEGEECSSRKRERKKKRKQKGSVPLKSNQDPDGIFASRSTIFCGPKVRAEKGPLQLYKHSSLSSTPALLPKRSPDWGGWLPGSSVRDR